LKNSIFKVYWEVGWKQSSGVQKRISTGELYMESRGRYVNDSDIPERRIDALARIMRGSSECVALAGIEGRLYVAANDLFRGSKDSNRTITHIRDVSSYFSDYTKPEVRNLVNRRSQLIEWDVIQQIKHSLRKPILPPPDNELKKAIKKLTERKQNDGYLLRPRELKEIYKTHPEVTSFLVDIFDRFDRDFKKLEQFLAEDNKQSKELKNLLSKTPRILKDSKKGGIHAEVQLLEKIVKLHREDKTLPKEIKIGISKLCCLHCRIMLNTANDVFNEKEIDSQVSFRGQHDIDSTWAPPELFEASYDDPNRYTRKVEKFIIR